MLFIKGNSARFLIFVISLVFIISTKINSYGQADTPLKNNTINIYHDGRIDSLISKLYSTTDDKPKINGYRIQIYSGSNKKEALKAKSDFLQAYDNITIYLIYEQPNYKIRVGDFRNRVEPQKLYHSLLNNENFNAVIMVN
ncbi:MAG: SPOR domain-containing protein [Bacteroidia bacterium]|nr:SPOR domain-containing protein [Bacteroidia bacterium]